MLNMASVAASGGVFVLTFNDVSVNTMLSFVRMAGSDSGCQTGNGPRAGFGILNDPATINWLLVTV